ncbi:MAG: vanadium-dependent haloperoxidase [Verrucomicrobiota bacterium]
MSNSKKINVSRRKEALRIRTKAAKSLPPFSTHKNNGEENDFDKFKHLSSFRKGLKHNGLGLVKEKDYNAFADACKSLKLSKFEKIPVGTAKNKKFRKWESPEAGAYFEINGSDAQVETMPPAPDLDSDELAAEMAEVYLMALLRDEPFTNFNNRGSSKAQKAVDALNSMDWFCKNPRGRRRGKVTKNNLFRGIAEGDDKGPVISQFLLAGNKDISQKPAVGTVPLNDSGMIEYGAHRIDQRVRLALQRKDFMTSFSSWQEVQNGNDIPNINKDDFVFKRNEPVYRFITTPRDMATYVHFDALYQSYLNACLILLAARAPFQTGFPYDGLKNSKGFAQFGGPHILTLVTEVATRALKAVRFQKFTNHRRARPEAVAGAISLYKTLGNDPQKNPYLAVKPLAKLVDKLDRVQFGKITLLESVYRHNKKQNGEGYFLPMAFPEGSPMHPAYGAGHATVAGACVTILKAFFDTSKKIGPVYVPISNGSRIRKTNASMKLTVLGELHKLAANISIGRNMAGVHYFTDYYESMVLGEQIAIQMLKEQAYTYTEKVEMRVPHFFDGKTTVIKSPPKGSTLPQP